MGTGAGTHLTAVWTEAISNAHLAQGRYEGSQLIQNIVKFTNFQL